jgi:hypothetical protein
VRLGLFRQGRQSYLSAWATFQSPKAGLGSPAHWQAGKPTPHWLGLSRRSKGHGGPPCSDPCKAQLEFDTQPKLYDALPPASLGIGTFRKWA